MSMKDKDITSYQLLLINQDRVLNAGKSGIFFLTFRKNMGRSGDGKRNILLGWPWALKDICLNKSSL